MRVWFVPSFASLLLAVGVLLIAACPVGAIPTVEFTDQADGTMQEVLTYSGLILSVRFPSDEPPCVPVPGSVLLVGCGLLCLRRPRHGSTGR